MTTTLFDPTPDHARARRSHPVTAQLAGHQIAPHVAKLHQWAQECVTAAPGLTQRELGARYCPTDPRKIGRRLVECERMGMVRRGGIRKCTVSGRQAETWWRVDGIKP